MGPNFESGGERIVRRHRSGRHVRNREEGGREGEGTYLDDGNDLADVLVCHELCTASRK